MFGLYKVHIQWKKDSITVPVDLRPEQFLCKREYFRVTITAITSSDHKGVIGIATVKIEDSISARCATLTYKHSD